MAGVMVEVPAADRQVSGLAAFQDPWQPALLARHTLEDCRRLAAVALAAPDAATARAQVRDAAPAAAELGL